MDIVPTNRPYGEARRHAALNLLRIRRAAVVCDLTRAVLGIALERGVLTADDVRALVPIPPGTCPCVAGAAIRDAAGILTQTGEDIRSHRPETHARPVTVWSLADGAAAWLAAQSPLTTT